MRYVRFNLGKLVSPLSLHDLLKLVDVDEDILFKNS